jgi:hypothetical protein
MSYNTSSRSQRSASNPNGTGNSSFSDRTGTSSAVSFTVESNTDSREYKIMLYLKDHKEKNWTALRDSIINNRIIQKNEKGTHEIARFGLVKISENPLVFVDRLWFNGERMIEEEGTVVFSVTQSQLDSDEFAPSEWIRGRNSTLGGL